jgi:hypothetical protein
VPNDTSVISLPKETLVTTSPVMTWLAHGLPLTLLCDLLAADGPDSSGICASERPPNDPLWAEAAQTLVLRHAVAG